MTQREFITIMFKVLPSQSKALLKNYTSSQFSPEPCITALKARNDRLKAEIRANETAMKMMEQLKNNQKERSE